MINIKAKIYKSNINTYHNELYIRNEIRNINDTLDAFDKLMKKEELNFNEYITLLKKIYNIVITDNDLFTISFLILEDISMVSIIPTNTLCTITKRIEVNAKFKYIDELHKLYIKIAYPRKKYINFDTTYDIKDIIKLVNDKKIILLEFILDEENECYCNEPDIEGLFPLNKITYNNFNNITYIKDDYIPAIYNFFKNYFNIKKLKKDLLEYIDDLYSKLDMLDNYINNYKNGYSLKLSEINFISNECRKIREREK